MASVSVSLINPGAPLTHNVIRVVRVTRLGPDTCVGVRRLEEKVQLVQLVVIGTR